MAARSRILGLAIVVLSATIATAQSNPCSRRAT